MGEDTESIASGAAGTEGPPPEGPTVPAVSRRGPGPGPRPVPTLSSMTAVAGGLLAFAGLFALLDAVNAGKRQGIGIAISLLFTALGVGLTVINRSKRSVAAGVALSALSALPLAFFLFFDSHTYGKVGDPYRGIGAFDGVAVRNSLILLTAGGLWLVGYLIGPGRRYAFYLGAALLAFWLVPVNHIVIDSVSNASPFARFGRITTSECFSATKKSSSSSSGSSSSPTTFSSSGGLTYSDSGSGSFSSGSGSSSGSFDCGSGPSRPFHEPSDSSVRLGVVSLMFAAAYLGMARVRDRRNDAAMATPFLFAGLVTIVVGFVALVGHMGPLPGALFLFALATIVLLVGVGGARRFSSWFGVFGAVAAVVWLVADTFDKSSAVAGSVLTALGLAVAIGVGVLERGDSAGAAPEPPAVAGEGHPVWGEAAADAPGTPEAPDAAASPEPA